ncbi:MAG: leucine-rich repeat domain-containing protein, partial [Clostridia bacterium]|nr:leucine-rich repeat domain-containing protein [Clostridia bacterium]
VSITLPESVTDIGLGAFGGCSSLETVYFGGSAEDWDRIEIGQSNSSLADAIIHYSKDTHEHIFDVKAAKRGFLKSEATCVMKAVYYYSCKCGEKGETTFEYGELAEHSFVNYVSDNNGSCTANCTETATCEKCGAVDVREIENSKVHSFAEGICTLCGSVYTSKGLTYTLNEDGVSYGLKYSINVTDTEVYIASTYEGLPVTVIKESAFRGANVTRVIIPEGVTAIERIAFSGSTVQSIKIPASIESIDTFAFLTCHSLTDITVDENNAHYKSVNGNLYTKDGKTILQYAIGKEETSFTVPQGVTAIGDWAFFFCKTLTEITLPDGLKSIGDNVFFNCTKLESINIPAGVTSIGECAFINCQSLTSIDIPEGVTTVGERAFTNCLSVTSITIPVSLTAIAKSAFSNCTALENVYYSGAEADWNKIDIADGNNVLTDATVYYYSETQPTEAGNFWHYGENNEITIW